MSETRPRAAGFVADHVAACDSCAAGDDVERIERCAQAVESLLEAAPAGPTSAGLRALSAAVRSAALPLLEMQARRLYWRRLAAGLAVTIVPLPLVYACALWALGVVHPILSRLTSEVIATWAVASYASLIVLGIALGCASVPLLVDRTIPGVARRLTA